MARLFFSIVCYFTVGSLCWRVNNSKVKCDKVTLWNSVLVLIQNSKFDFSNSLSIDCELDLTNKQFTTQRKTKHANMVTGGLTLKNVVMLLFSLWYLQFPQMPASCLSASINLWTGQLFWNDLIKFLPPAVFFM